MAKTDDYRRPARIFLLMNYLLENTCQGHTVNWTQIEEYFEDNNITVHSNTFYTDIQTLRDEMGVDVVFDRHTNGYYVRQRDFEPYELRLMVDSVQASKFITKQKAQEIANKIKGLTDKHTRTTLNRPAVVADRVRSMNDSVVKDADKIFDALRKCQISFQYFHYTPDKSNEKKYSKDGKRIVVSPYELTWNDGNYYLYAYDGKKFRRYRVDRMERITALPSLPVEGKEEYRATDKDRQKAKVFDMYSTGKIYTVKMRFRNELAHTVIDEFGKDIMLIPDGAEHFTISVPVDVAPTFFAWITTFGRRAKVIGPAPVVAEMREFIEKVADMYKDDGNT